MSESSRPTCCFTKAEPCIPPLRARVRRRVLPRPPLLFGMGWMYLPPHVEPGVFRRPGPNCPGGLIPAPRHRSPAAAGSIRGLAQCHELLGRFRKRPGAVAAFAGKQKFVQRFGGEL
ncbi:hypothetical protein FALCPG4_003353 [Fusarium falciforme]